MILDLRQPVLVFAGSFNPAIFSPPWMLRNLFGIPDGQNVDVTTIFDAGQDMSPRYYIQKVGVVATPQRLAIYADEMTEEVIARAEGALVAVAETLPHTPAGAFGVNFQFEQLAVSAELVDSIMPRDGLEALGQISSTDVSSNIMLNDRDQLNVSRRLSGPNIGVSFNFHYPITGLQEVVDGRQPKIAEELARAKEILSDRYGQDLEELQFQKALN